MKVKKLTKEMIAEAANCKTIEEKLDFISKNTKDEKLKKEIENKINNDNRLYEMFKDNSEKQLTYQNSSSLHHSWLVLRL